MVFKTAAKGDTARFTYVAEVYDMGDSPKFVKWAKSGDMVVAVPADATVEVLERADDPARDRIGTYRREDHEDGFSIFQAMLDRSDARFWLCVYSTAAGNRLVKATDADVVGARVVGAVPGSPAAEVTVTGEDIDRWAQADEVDSIWDGEAGRRVPFVPQRADKQTRRDASWPKSPRVFRSDGPEPPDGVDKLKAERPIVGWTHIERDGEYWRWSNESSRALGSQPWPANSMGIQFREVPS